MTNLTLVHEYLGGPDVLGTPRTEMDFVSKIREGFPSTVYASICERSKLKKKTVFSSLRISKRTAARRESGEGRLKPAESEAVLRLARVLAAAQDALGSTHKATSWIMTQNRALGTKPIKLLDTAIGFQEVMNVLGRLEHGVYS